MSINNNDIINASRYFKVSSGYVPNQFSVRIIKAGVGDQESGNARPNNPLYLLNLEPWVIEELVLPQIRFNTSNDMYMDADTLIKPDYITSVITTGKLEIKLREKSDLAIHRSLIRCQQEMYNSSYEGTGTLGSEYSIEVRIKSQRFDDNAANGDNIFGDNYLVFGRALLTEISNPTFSFSEKSFLRYSITFDVNCMAETYRLDKIPTMKVFKNNISSTIGGAKIKTNPDDAYSAWKPKLVTGAKAEAAIKATAISKSNTAAGQDFFSSSFGDAASDLGTISRDGTYTPSEKVVDAMFSSLSSPSPVKVLDKNGNDIFDFAKPTQNTSTKTEFPSGKK